MSELQQVLISRIPRRRAMGYLRIWNWDETRPQSASKSQPLLRYSRKLAALLNLAFDVSPLVQEVLKAKVRVIHREASVS